MSTAAAPVPEASGYSNSLARIFGVLFSPKSTFESIAQKPTWLVPLILMSIVSLGVTILFSQRVGWRTFMERQIAQSASAQRRMEQVPADQREQVLNQQAKFAGGISYVASTVGTFIGAVVVAAVLLGALNLIAGAKVGFVSSLSIVSYAWIPYAIQGLLGLLVILIKDPSTVDLQNLVASNPGALLPDDSAKWLTSLLTSLDLFTFWVLALLGMGYGATNPKKLPFGKSFGIVVSVWLIWILVKVGLAAAFS